MFSFSQSFSKPGSGTTFIIGGKGQYPAGKADGESHRSFIETVSTLSVDGLNTETWDVALLAPGSSEWKTLTTGLTKASMYHIEQDLLYQAIRITISGTTACTIRLGSRPQPSRNYG